MVKFNVIVPVLIFFTQNLLVIVPVATLEAEGKEIKYADVLEPNIPVCVPATVYVPVIVVIFSRLVITVFISLSELLNSLTFVLLSVGVRRSKSLGFVPVYVVAHTDEESMIKKRKIISSFFIGSVFL